MTRWDPNTTGSPSSSVLDLASRLTPNARVLDIGCGEMASNAIYLARCQFVVDAFDSSSRAVQRATARAQELGVDLEIWQQNLSDFSTATEYEAVLCRGVLHFLDAARWDRAFSAIQRATKRSGWNVLSIFDDHLPMPHDLLPIVRRVLRPNELEARYRCWQIVDNESYVLCDEHPGGIRHRHSITRFLARRR
jgi:cyclopropane fatty-acyl-phospholipid synthase-like methyltransferase